MSAVAQEGWLRRPRSLPGISLISALPSPRILSQTHRYYRLVHLSPLKELNSRMVVLETYDKSPAEGGVCEDAVELHHGITWMEESVNNPTSCDISFVVFQPNSCKPTNVFLHADTPEQCQRWMASMSRALDVANSPRGMFTPRSDHLSSPRDSIAALEGKTGLETHLEQMWRVQRWLDKYEKRDKFPFPSQPKAPNLPATPYEIEHQPQPVYVDESVVADEVDEQVVVDREAEEHISTTVAVHDQNLGPVVVAEPSELPSCNTMTVVAGGSLCLVTAAASGLLFASGAIYGVGHSIVTCFGLTSGTAVANAAATSSQFVAKTTAPVAIGTLFGSGSLCAASVGILPAAACF